MGQGLQVQAGKTIEVALQSKGVGGKAWLSSAPYARSLAIDLCASHGERLGVRLEAPEHPLACVFGS